MQHLPNIEGFHHCRLLQQCSVYMYAVSCSLTQLAPSVHMLSHFNIVFFKPGASPLLHLSFCRTSPPPYFLGSAGCLPLAVYHSSWYLRTSWVGWLPSHIVYMQCLQQPLYCLCIMGNELNWLIHGSRCPGNSHWSRLSWRRHQEALTADGVDVVLLFSKYAFFPPNSICSILPNMKGFQHCRLLQQCSVYM